MAARKDGVCMEVSPLMVESGCFHHRKCRANRYPALHAKWLRQLSTGVPLPKKLRLKLQHALTNEGAETMTGDNAGHAGIGIKATPQTYGMVPAICTATMLDESRQ